ncbi:RhuM family protein [Massilia sp. NP310]|uniref:RhuM family protein n=1 Tax=Massilia sp. NP310 TaxID=2861282 RepID=UPI001C6252B7|nr:RhuM family protein [Massilia sp. NP310]QYG01837.1 virulence RhuM family protein [Massilia sp. NP310]
MEAREIIERLGGQSAVAEHLGKGQSTVAYWVKTGVIPARWKPQIFLLSVKLGVPLTAEELIGTPDNPIAASTREVSVPAPNLPPPPAPRAIATFVVPAQEAAALSGQEVVFSTGDSQVSLKFDTEAQAIWATQEQIAQIFSVDRTSISRHIANVFADEELDEKSNVQKVHIAKTDRAKAFYSLDVIISVGYRVNSRAATEFRKWATQTLRAYLDQGYVINEKALRESPEKLNRLAAQIRSLRSEEKQVYAKVRECFKLSSSDYDPESRTVKSFYALLQDKFHHAVTGLTASKLIMDRADHKAENMGLQSMKGERPTLADATAGKNYLKPEELYRLHILSEQFLLYAEGTALAGKNMTMESLHRQLDRLLTLNDYPVFDGYKDYIKDLAIQHARIELGQYKKRLKIEAMGLDYDEDALAAGEYDGFLLES